VLVRVVTQPPGADVYIGDQVSARGQTPVALTLPRGTASETVTVRLKGYEPQTAEVTPDSDSRLQLNLVKASPRRASKHVTAPETTAPSKGPVAASPPTTTPPAPSNANTTSAPAPAPAAPKVPSPNLHRGDVVDPFAPAR
jgi:hypothetical protein